MSARSSYSCFSCFHFFLLVVLALFRLCSSNQNSQCNDVERQALLQFKHGLTDESQRLASWVAENKDCCTWAGIACENSTGHVHGIHLRGLDGHCGYQDYDLTGYEEPSKQKLKGAISRSLLDLKQLKHLDLSCNDFGYIQVPKFIGSFQNLRYLNLSRSNFGGSIPPQLGNLSELHVLCLGSFHDDPFERTSMANMKWLSSLGMLHHMDMSGVDLSKATNWLQVINTLPSLVQLHLSGCELSNLHMYVPSVNLTSLSVLDLSQNYFSSAVSQWIFSVTSLVSLDLSWCNFHGPIPSFRNLTSLELLHVAETKFMNSSSIFQELSGTNLVSLDIESCGISSSLLDSLQNLTNLISLDLSQNQLTKRIPKSLGNFCNLREIDLSRNNIVNISLTYFLESFFECKSPALESLSLIRNHITGIIPHSIGNLSFLRTLDLSDNQISGPIPYSIGRLLSLEGLDFSYNQINGSFPDSIGQLSSLEILDASFNKLDGNLPDSIGQLSSLVDLPHSIGQLSSLEELSISYNRLDGSLPDSLGQLSKLTSLDFSYNLLTGVMTEAHFIKLVSLKDLKGSANKLILRLQAANWIPPFQLEYLSLINWVLGPQFPLWLQSQKDLMELDICNTGISSPMPESFVRSFSNLYYLNMSNNHIRGPLTFSGIPATLEIIDISSNGFWGSLHPLLCSSGVTSTYFLNLGNNNLSGEVPECWEKWPELVLLNLENNSLSGEIPRTLGSLNLQYLNMHGNKFSGRLHSSLMNLTELDVLELGRNELTGSIPTWIGRKLTRLRILNLRSNRFAGNIPHELCHIRHIQILDLAHNNLSGNVPRCFNNFSILSGIERNSRNDFAYVSSGHRTPIAGDSLVTNGREDTYSSILPLVMLIDLSCNNLTGYIPSELMSLLELKSLNLSRNQLSGSIPEKIGNMKELISLDLSVNWLSGELPMSLSKLNFLSSFNVSFNSLTGRIPTSTQLQSFSESSFFGNKLCGAPLTETNGCERVKAATHTIGEKKEEDGADWGLIISIVVGFVCGFWMIMGPLIVRRSWRIAYFSFVSNLRYMVYDVIHKYCCHMFSS
ncbi:putative leucine-rich repeat-containing, plant-type, leucine-rich repeat domain superfamily [Helianthus annuus]|uniref:Leucine-rich repeat-containing, plant-type, leucine-rich repeat domain superfamily n=3 Tax=Helianthus annuus TaxID=4232 RepID=A0A251SD28_HELAN|nr:putative leucine-rich repeat-containing, plant-type, leucine-rich repeat domain superfamily [Helianthus annuus]KAJ0579605.1 putative leucine-rich repeat-containing, plant-type, leucine-rich repeat domain superfamily [Helianthus annuus]KAJ0595501.1 putative leucine-rich repeat-containing, plant-type, leucine-rich repeat domain superfamily [Helianthus annuus]KAJ0929673.1 putative leucine-rich repeat-containing, plant-type, leucine-rich repeat domain superfamily [Helianthus annuus]